jgi:hypothetical protein
LLARTVGVLNVVVTCNKGDATAVEAASSGLMLTALRLRALVLRPSLLYIIVKWASKSRRDTEPSMGEEVIGSGSAI